MKIPSIALLLMIGTCFASEPDRLTKLRSSYETAVARAMTPLTKAYAQELEKLKTDFTRAGDLDSALAVAEELKKYAAGNTGTTAAPGASASDAPKRLKQFKTTDEFLAWIVGTKWTSDKAEFVYIRFVDASHFVWFGRKIQAENQPVEMRAEKTGVLKFRYSSGGDGTMVVSDDLKEIQLGSAFFKLEKK